MKTKILFICFACIFSWQIRADINDDYHSIIKDGHSWNIFTHPSIMDFYKSTMHAYFDGDSIVGDYTYKKVFYDYKNQTHKYEGLVREDGKKSYIILPDTDTEYLLYDFSLEEGDVFEYPNRWDPTAEFYSSKTILVKQVDYVEVNGTMRKQMLLFDADWDVYIVDTWIEGVGSLSGIIDTFFGLFHDGSITGLLCQYQDDELIYKNPDYSECYYDYSTSVEEVGDAVYSLFPNPVEDVLTISSSETISQVDIFDASGKKIYSQLGGNDINMATFIKGMYFVKVYGTMNEARSFKIIKN